jgi:hypothetical protein
MNPPRGRLEQYREVFGTLPPTRLVNLNKFGSQYGAEFEFSLVLFLQDGTRMWACPFRHTSQLTRLYWIENKLGNN